MHMPNIFSYYFVPHFIVIDKLGCLEESLWVVHRPNIHLPGQILLDPNIERDKFRKAILNLKRKAKRSNIYARAISLF